MKILIVEDEPVSRRLLESFLCKWGYDVFVTTDGRMAWELLQKPDAPSLVISDWMMPVMDGLSLCRKIRGMNGSSYIYIIILTAKGRKEDIIKGLEAGADDYLIKPFNKEELKCRIKIGERIIKLEQRILQLAHTDFLTGVLNRRAFMERMDEEVNKSNRTKNPLSIILTDIDYFKKINDTYGHQVGDLILKQFTKQLSTSIRIYDFIGRYGGEEFTICIPDTDENQSNLIAERIRQSVEKMSIPIPNRKKTIKITASFGVASLKLQFKEDVDSLIKRADEALYSAKKKGRNCVCMAI